MARMRLLLYLWKARSYFIDPVQDYFLGYLLSQWRKIFTMFLTIFFKSFFFLFLYDSIDDRKTPFYLFV
jgi:hypothetical protein